MSKFLEALVAYKHLLVCSVFTLVMFFCFRLIGSIIYYTDIIPNEIPEMLFQGLRVDISLLGYLTAIPVLLTFLMQLCGNSLRHILFSIEKLYLVFTLSLLFFLELSSFSFIEEYGQRPNRIFIEYLIYPREVIKLMVNNHKHLITSIIIIAVMIVAIVFLWKILKNKLKFPKAAGVLPALIIFIIVGNISFICGRSSFQHRPFNLAKAYFSTNQMVNVLTGNSAYTLVSSIKAAYSEKIVSYPHQDNSMMLDNIRKSTGFDYAPATENRPTLNHLKPTGTANRFNVVVILEESFGSQFVKGLGGLDLAPNIDQLCKDYWCFTNMYATGVRSIRGIEAVTTGFTPTINRAVVKREKSQHNFFNLAQVFKNKGYESLFIYGGESNFDNMRSFFLGNGYTHIVDYTDFKDPSFVATWGVSDEDLFAKSLEEFDKLSQDNKPFYALVFTSSNHDPFEIPDNKVSIKETTGELKRFAAVKYADFALGDFIQKVKTKSYYENTIFVVIADHDARVTGRNMVPIEHFHIPAVIFGGGIRHKIEDHVVSQIDMPKTILSLVGIEIDTPMLGYDLSNLPENFAGRAMMQYYDNFVLMQDDGKVALVQPEKEVITMKYNKHLTTLEPSSCDDKFNSLALSYALIGERAYQDGYYIFENE